jgi:hypothetical protein
MAVVMSSCGDGDQPGVAIPVDARDGGAGSDVRDGPSRIDIRGDGGDSVCRGSIDAHQPFTGCPATFDDPRWMKDVGFTPTTVTERVCDGYRSRRIDLGTHAWTCYYAPATLTLVAAQFQNDVASFCDGGNFEITLGDVPQAGTCGEPMVIFPPAEPDDAGSQDALSESGT